MTETGDADGITIGGDTRVTRIGRFLRDTKIDELPQLINVLAGDMSLVGPRPEIPAYVERYSGRDRRIVFSVAPGLTDFASIRFRNESELLATKGDPLLYYETIIMPAKLRYCRLYIRRAGFQLDLWLLALTVRVLAQELASFTRRDRVPCSGTPAGVVEPFNWSSVTFCRHRGRAR
jgi:lipopolysaccharide/colanic/teichoic acid biosynthesis glycosyltransferase